MKSLLTILFISLVSSAFSAEVTLVWNNKWFDTTLRKDNAPFDNSSELSAYGQVPFFQQNQILNSNVSSFEVQFKVLKTELLSATESKGVNNLTLPNDFIVEKRIATYRKNSVAQVFVAGLRKNAQGQAEKLLSFELEIKDPAPAKVAAMGKSAYKTSTPSVLASGSWYKIKVSASGIYKIDKAFLQSMGVNPSAINPQYIRIYGNGGGMLPELISTYTPDDLQENAIMVSGENDGVFNDNDYVLFYARGPHTWKFDTNSSKYTHQYNVYADEACYFLNFDLGPGKRISAQSQDAAANTHTATKFDDYSFQENDSYNFIKSGRVWYGDLFNIVTKQRLYNFSFPNIDLSTPAIMNVQLATRSTQTSAMAFDVNGTPLPTSLSSITPISTGYDDPYTVIKTSLNNSFTPSSSNFTIKMTYSLPNNEAESWLNYMEVIVRRNLVMSGSSLSFRDASTRGSGNVVLYQISSTSGTETVWDISNILNVKNQDYNFNSGQISFKQAADTLKEYIVFSGSDFSSPTFVGSVANQNIHGIGSVDYVIVCAPEFLSAAKKLADFHESYSNLDVLLVTPMQVYNEFSSGAKDVTAIRNMMRYFYKKAASPAELPKYLLMFGDGSYDYKGKVASGDFVPVYESSESNDPTSSYATDDYFGFLDDNEGDMDPNSSDNVDIGIGRFPVTTLEQADGVVNKIIHYAGHGSKIAVESKVTPYINGAFGDWRNQVVFVADDGSDPNGNYDYAEHINGCETLSKLLRGLDSSYNHDKIYFDAFIKQSSAGGGRYPDVERGINQVMDKGALIVSYVGHGGEAGWADERVLGIQQINQWNNFTHLPFFVTATCEFSRFDDPQRVSAGEYVLLNANGGGIGQLTTTRLVYGSSNLDFSKNFFKRTFLKSTTPPTLGLALEEAKTLTSNGTYNNKRKFFLMGDPALTLAFPLEKVVTTAINQHPVGLGNDTLKALMKVKVEGKLVDRQGKFLSTYNGIIYPTIYDKSQDMKTLNNISKSTIDFDMQSNILYKGKATVSNGLFAFEFIVPKDISYQYGNGKISYYVANESTDAGGFFENFMIGGTDSSSSGDNEGPEVDLYMNDSSFVTGGLTNQNPKIFVVLYDESGINTTGNNIGHDIVATLDKQSSQSMILNSFYEADLDSYKRGKISYPLENLSEGEHQLSLKVWDVNNNSAESNTTFYVSSSAELALSHVLNYPNPFTTRTEFWFEHNQPIGTLNVQIQIYSIAGKLVKNINTTIEASERYKPAPIAWDGLDDYGDAIGKGVYIYHLKVQTENGQYAEKTEKLVILK
ncbi:MAG: type IX secretion system sortase PorU [Flavobacteriales bacterium]